MPKYRINFANFPGDGKTSWQTSAWCTKTFHRMKQDPRILEVSPGYYGPDTPITMLRNRCVYDALEEGADYLLMIDSDISPDSLLGKDPNAEPFWDVAWEFMMRRREEGRQSPATIAAPYVGPPPNECPYIFLWKNFESLTPNPNYKLEMLERETAALRLGIEEVAALPTGLILYDTRVFRRIPKPWFDYEWKDENQKEKASTEDVYQTRNASLAGCPQYVAWNCWADHIKTKHCTKPQPWTIEVLSKKFHESIISGRSANKQLMFVGDPVDAPAFSGVKAPVVAKTDGEIQGRFRSLSMERNLGVENPRVGPQDGFGDEGGRAD
jgi:hypothetical protein